MTNAEFQENSGLSSRSGSKKVAMVTGAAGFIGSHLVERLLHQGLRVLAIDCFTNYYPRRNKEENISAFISSPDVTFVEGDLRQLDLETLLADNNIQYVFHEAGQAGVRPSWGRHFQEYVNCNILATQALLEASRNHHLERFIFASSSSVYGDAEKLPTSEDQLPRPVSPYGVSKLAAEHLCLLYARQYGLPVTALRYFSVYGPRQRPDMAFRIFIRALLRGEPIQLLGDGEQTRDFTFVQDIIDANILAMQTFHSAGQVYNIGGGSRVTLNKTVELLAEIMNVEARVERKPRAPGDHRHGAADISRARQELNYEPCVGLKEGLRRQVEWQKAIDGVESSN